MVKTKSGESPKQLEIELPDKKYFTIGEVSELCDLKPHVLRYWEQVFPQLEPSKRRGRRYYQRRELELVLEIKTLLHDQGFTIPGAKARLNRSEPPSDVHFDKETDGQAYQNLLNMKSDLKAFLDHIRETY